MISQDVQKILDEAESSGEHPETVLGKVMLRMARKSGQYKKLPPTPGYSGTGALQVNRVRVLAALQNMETATTLEIQNAAQIEHKSPTLTALNWLKNEDKVIELGPDQWGLL